MGASGKIDMTTVDLDNSGITIANVSADMAANVLFGSLTEGFINKRTWSDSYETLQIMSLSSTKSRVALTVLNAGWKTNGYNRIADIEQDAYVSKATITAGSVVISGNTAITRSSKCNRCYHAKWKSGLRHADLTPSNYSLTSHNHSGVYSEVAHNHSGVYAAASHTHAFGDISGNGNINTTGTVTAASDTDSTHILGRQKIGSPASDTAYFSHYDKLSTTEYALSQTAGR